MSLHLEREINHLKKRIVSLCVIVEECVKESVKAIEEKSEESIRRVLEKDALIDEMEIEVEEECLKLLALHQPVAVDLRFIVAVLKLNNDLERIGDLAVNITEQVEFIIQHKPVNISFDFIGMFEKSISMVKRSLDSLVEWDVNIARDVCKADDEVDDLNRQMFELVKKGVRNNPPDADVLICYLSISRHLERIADHATNIAEDVIYMIEGNIVRHMKTDDSRKKILKNDI